MLRRGQRIHIGQPLEMGHPLNAGLTARWLALPEFMGSTIWRDLLGKYHGNLVGMDPATDWRKYGGAKGMRVGTLDFDASNDRVQLPKIEALNIDNTLFTIVASFIQGAASQVAVARGSSATITSGGWAFSSVNFFTKSAGGVNAYVRSNSVTPGTGVLIHSVATGIYLTTGTVGQSVDYYTNGRLTNGTETNTLAAGSSTTMPFAMGCRTRQTAGDVYETFQNVRVIDVALYKGRKMDAGQVAALYAEWQRGCPQTLNWISTRYYSIPEVGGATAFPWLYYARQRVRTF